MADISDINAALPVKIIGSDVAGVETTPVASDSNGNLKVIDPAIGPVTPGTVALNSELIGGQYNSTPPTLSNGQQAALQVDSKGKLIVSNTSTPVTTAFNTIISVSGASSTQLLASNSNRLMAYITNNTNKSLWIKLGGTAVVGQGIEIGAGGGFGIESTGLWTGVVNGIMSGGGSLNIDVFEGTP